MSNTNYDMDALFNPKIEVGGGSQNADEYNPSADKGQNGVYKSVIRFVSWWQDPNHSYIDKWVSWLVDPVTGYGKVIDCPSSVGKNSPLMEMYRKLKNSESIQEQKKAEVFSRRHQYTLLIQVIKDDNNRDLEGKILVWKVGKKIWEKYEAEKKPVMGEPHEPFNLLDGKAFALVITKVAGFNNYDQSRFLDKRIPLLIPDQSGKLIPITDKTPRETVFNFLKENSPDLGKYNYREWDTETYDYVNSVITAVTGAIPSTGYASVRNSTGQSTSSPQSAAKISETSGITSTEISLDDLNNLGSTPGIDISDINLDNDLGLSGNLDDALEGL